MNLIQKTILAITVLAGSLVVLGVANTAEAQVFSASKKEACKGANLSNSDDNCNKDTATNTVEGIIRFIVNLLTIIVGIVAVIMIIINGLKFITSAGDSNAISAARNGILYAIVGLIIVALAQVIVRFVIGRAT